MVMDWESHPLKEIETWVLDGIFDRAKGWEIPEEQASVKRLVAKDGNPSYVVIVDDIKITAFEQHKWADGVSRSVSAGRLCATVEFSNVTILKPQLFLTGSFEARGLPSFGIRGDGQPTLHAAFPIAPNFPVDLARRQLMVCMGSLAESAKELLIAWNQKPAPAKRPVNWDVGKNVASVAGTFLRAFVGL